MDFESQHEESLSELAFAMELEDGAERTCPLLDLPHTGEEVRFLQASMFNQSTRDHWIEEMSDFEIARDNLELEVPECRSPACFFEELFECSYKSPGDRSPNSVADIASSAGAWTPKLDFCEFSVHVHKRQNASESGKGRQGDAVRAHANHTQNLHEFFAQFRETNAGSTPATSASEFSSILP